MMFCTTSFARTGRKVRGMALVAVLWIVAALSLLVVGATQSVHQQIQVAGVQGDQVRGQAAGEAALMLVLQQLQVAQERVLGIERVDVTWQGVPIAVEVAPLNGLVSLTDAPPELLAAVFEQAGGLPAAWAAQLALDLVLWRDTPPDLDLSVDARARGQARGFEAVEDLLLVPGVDYDLYERVAPLLSADLVGVRQVNPLAAPPEVLHVLSRGNEAAVGNYLAQRQAGQPGADTSAFDSAFVRESAGHLYRLRADVPLETGKILRLTQDMALGTYARVAPWRVLRTERRIVSDRS